MTLRVSIQSLPLMAVLSLVLALTIVPETRGQTPGSTFLGTRWALDGPKNAVIAPPYGNGESDWSIVAPGIGTTQPPDASHPINALSLLFDALLPPPNVPNPGDNIIRPATLFQQALNIWETGANSLWQGLGPTIDGGGIIGGAGAASNQGDMRVAVLRFTTPPPISSATAIDDILAHAAPPDTDTQALTGFNSLGGDVHFRPHKYGPNGIQGDFDDDANGVVWVDNNAAPAGTFDLLTVMIHEVGHALGLGHNEGAMGDPNSVMNPTYTAPRRTLSANDITNIQTLYAPEPSCALLMMGVAAMVRGRRRWRTSEAK